MKNISIATFIIAVSYLLYAVLSVLFIERIPEEDNKKVDKIVKTIQKGISVLYAEPHQHLFIVSLIAVIVFPLSSLGISQTISFISGIIFAIAIEKTAETMIIALMRRTMSGYRKSENKGIGLILSSAEAVAIFAIGLAVIAPVFFYGAIKNVLLLLPFSLGFSAAAVFIKFFSRGIPFANNKNLKNIAKCAGIVSCGMEFTENIVLSAGAAIAIGALTPGGAAGKSVVLPIALLAASALVFVLNIFLGRFVIKKWKHLRKGNALVSFSAAAMAAAAFFLIKFLDFPLLFFWPIAIGVALAVVLEIFNKNDGNFWKKTIRLGAIYFFLSAVFRFDGAFSLSLAVVGMVSVLNAVFAHNFAAGFSDMAAEAADYSEIEENINEKMAEYSFEKCKQILNTGSLSVAVSLFAVFICKAGIASISLEAGRTLFALLLGGLIVVFLQKSIKNLRKKAEEKSDVQENFLDSGNFKLIFYDIAGIIAYKEMVILAAGLIFPVIIAFILGVEALAALFIGMMAAGFAGEEDEIVSAIKLMLILAIVIFPMMI